MRINFLLLGHAVLGNLSELDSVTNVGNILNKSGLSSCLQQRVLKKFKFVRRKLAKSYQKCPKSISKRSADSRSKRSGSGSQTELEEYVVDIKDWSDNHLDCNNGQYTFGNSEVNDFEDFLENQFEKQTKRDENGRGCDPSDSDQALDNNPQWEDEKGYWIGDYTFLGSDGNARYKPDYWNYPYDHYTGFIVGAVDGNSYAQRNVFLYPPQTAENCAANSATTDSDDAVCGVNGNHKMFFADQSADKCSYNNPGAIEGVFAFSKYTWTTLMGQRDDSVFYEVYDKADGTGPVAQKQLTTIHRVTKEDGSVEVRRTRTAQGFSDDGSDDYASYYRERKVSKEEFYTALADKVTEYNILQSDWKVNGPGKYYGYNQFFQMDPDWAATVAAKTGTIEIFEAFLETAYADVL